MAVIVLLWARGSGKVSSLGQYLHITTHTAQQLCCSLLIMAALCNRAGHYIFVLWFLLCSSFFLFFLPFPQPSQVGCLPYFHTWCGLSVNLECRSEMCCMWLAVNTGCKNDEKNCHMHTIAPLCRAISLQLCHVSTIGKKLVKHQYLFHMSLQYGKIRLISGWDQFGSWDTPANLNGFLVLASYCSDITHQRPIKLCTMFGRLLGWYIIYSFLGAVPPDGILPGAKFTLRPSLAFSYIGSVTAQHSSSGRQPNFGAWYKEWNYRTFGRAAITFGICPHSSFHLAGCELAVSYDQCSVW